MLKILQAPNEVLSKASQEIPVASGKLDAEILKLIKDMEITLEHAENPKGVGLAAPQVGKSIALFITKPSDKAKLQVFINPSIISSEDKPKKPKTGKNKGKKLEGCLSLQDIWGEVKRSDFVTVKYLDEKGVQHEKKFSGFMSIIVQHEIDHLNGILFPKRVLEQAGDLYKSHVDEKGEMIFDPIEI